MTLFPRRTERLLLAPLTASDQTAFVAYRRDPEVARFQSWDADYSDAAAADLLAHQPAALPGPGEWLQLAVRDSATGALLGDVAVHRIADQPDTFELGVTLARSSQGRGIAREALVAVLDLLFDEAGAHRVIAQADARNTAVARLLTGLGMRHEARHLDADWFKGEWTTLDVFAILSRDLAGASHPDPVPSPS